MAGYTLITGGAGFIGSNLADELLSDGREVVVADNLSRPGVSTNADWLRRRHGGRVWIRRVDVRDADAIAPLVRDADEVYHLAAQVAVTTSVEDPGADLQTNLIGTFHILEAARARETPPPVLFTSTNKVYGALGGVESRLEGDRYVYGDREAIDEAVPLDFRSPYGCSKGAADQYVVDYARIYDIPTAVFRMSCVYGRRQWGTEDQGWVAHFGRALLAGEPITIYGDGHQVRDILWVDDLVAAIRKGMLRAEAEPGSVYNIGGGPSNAVTVTETVDRLSDILDRIVPVRYEAWRTGDQRRYVTDTRKAEQALRWKPRVGVAEGLERLGAWLEEIMDRKVVPLRGRLASTAEPTARGA
ncbi:MAG: SDR family NAD(P)-dependent oxidoreductase [Gemmatimonadetes bacterium]|nr:SDR family NAD(P)-dependent oxidoreductase [Gemmatimonadota bacterium]